MGPHIECEGWRRHSSLIFLILLFTKPNIEVSGWLYQTKTHFTHIVYQPFSRVSSPSFTLYGLTLHVCISVSHYHDFKVFVVRFFLIVIFILDGELRFCFIVGNARQIKLQIIGFKRNLGLMLSFIVLLTKKTFIL